MLEGLIKAVRKGYRADSSYKANSWKIALNHTLAVTQQPITIKQIKSKHNNHKKDWKLQKELYNLSSQGQDKDKGVPITSKEVIEAYFKANPTTKKFRNTPPIFLNLLQELFNGILATGNYTRLINKAIKSYIDPKLLGAVASQALGLVDKEDKNKDKDKDEEEVDKASKLELALSSIKRNQLSLPLAKRPSPSRSSSLTLSQPSLLAIRKRAIK